MITLMDRRPQLPEGLDPESIKSVAARHGGRRVRIFGSRARGHARPDSDLDLLVEMEEGRSYLDLVSIALELESRCGVRVDLHSDRALRAPVAARAEADAVAL